jgi:serine/threonine protein kinase
VRDTQEAFKSSTKMSHIAGTMRWQAPELVGSEWEGSENHICTGRTSDVYALGCVFYEVCISMLHVVHQTLDIVADILRKNSFL